MRFDEHLLTTSTQLVPVALLRIAAYRLRTSASSLEHHVSNARSCSIPAIADKTKLHEVRVRLGKTFRKVLLHVLRAGVLPAYTLGV